MAFCDPSQLRDRTEGVVCLAYGKILFVGENQEKGIAQLVFVQHPLQLLTCLDNTISIIAVDDSWVDLISNQTQQAHLVSQ